MPIQRWRPRLRFRLGIWLVVVWALGGTSNAATRLTVTAVVDANLQTVHGHLQMEGDVLPVADPLNDLPIPKDDILQRRTFPGSPQAGLAQHTPFLSGRSAFTTVLPKRYGAAGMVPHRGLFANGLWHPQPLRDGAPAVVEWDVTVEIPSGTVGVLNGVVGEGALHWTGTADRLALAVVPDARVMPLELEVGTVQLVERGPPRPRRQRRLTEAVLAAWQGPGAPNLVVVDTPSRRRLTRTGPQVLFLSDRAFRVTGGLWRFHLPAVQQGILEAGLPLSDPFEREIAAAALAQVVDPGLDIQEMLGWWAWIPEIDALLYDGRLPFYSDVFTEIWPGDPVADDLTEVLAPTTPGQAICARLQARQGPDICERLAWKLIQTADLEGACEALGIDASELQQSRSSPSPQRLWLEVDQPAQLATIHRDLAEVSESGRRTTGGDLPPEVIQVLVNDELHTWEAPAGPSSLQLPLPADTQRIAIDPHKATLQDDRSDDRWPTRWVPVAAFFPSELSITNRRVSAWASVALRQQYDTRWVFVGDIGTNAINLAESSIGGVYAFGPLQDRRSRPFRVWFGAGPALLNPGFRPVSGRGISMGAYAGVSHSTIVDGIFPTSGHSVRLRASGGLVPGDGTWMGAGGSASGVQRLGGRVALAGRVSADVATGDVLHRLIPLGGGSALQGVTPQAVVGEERLLARSELRWQPIRFASVPGPLIWLSHVQLTGGLEAGTLTADGVSCRASTPCQWSATGWSGGVLFTGDVLGVRPTVLGATLAGPLTWNHDALRPGPFPQLYVRLTQAL